MWLCLKTRCQKIHQNPIIDHHVPTQKGTFIELRGYTRCSAMAVCQNLVPLVNIKIAGKWMFIPLKMVLIGIDPYPYHAAMSSSKVLQAQSHR